MASAAQEPFVTEIDESLPLRDFDPSREGTTASARQPGETEDAFNARWRQVAPETVSAAFAKTVARVPESTAMAVKRDGDWLKWSWSQYSEDARCAARACIALGLERFGVSAILGFNSPEWFLGYISTVLAGGVAAGVYSTNGPDAVHYVLEHSRAQIVFVENDAQLAKMVAIADRLPSLKAVVQWIGSPSEDAAATIKKGGVEHVLNWEGFMNMGRDEQTEKKLDGDVEARIEDQKPEQCCALIYTSGTTGNPKAVMISHDNLVWTAKNIVTLFEFTEDDTGCSYLPLSHIAAQILDLVGPMTCGAGVWFAQPDALKGSLVDTLKEVRPTLFFGVPRVWEKVCEKMRAVGRSNTGVKKMIGDWAKGVGATGNRSLQKGGAVPWGWWLANTLVFENVKKALGLDRCRFFATGAAPLSMEVLDYFNSLNIPIREVYGMSECTGPQTFNTLTEWRTGTCGVNLPATQLKIAEEDGEICYQGRNTFMGYLRAHDATAETIDADGWLHSGDIGKVDGEGFLRITGRKKELLITAGGENVAPVLIEDEIKRSIPDLIKNVMVIGDRQKYLSCIITWSAQPKDPMSIKEDEYPFEDFLSNEALEVAQSVGSDAKSVAEACECPKLRAHVEAGIAAANKEAISRACVVQKFHPVLRDFTLEGNELTPTMKLKRRIVLEKYDAEIREMYGEDFAE
jgi:long-chain-fatty-acid--CoA ligase ACSBG